MIASLFRSLVVPAYEGAVRGRTVFRHLRQLERTQWAEPKQLETLQLEGLRRLLTHAKARCDYYRSRWQEIGLEPSRVHSFRDFQNWPVTTRETIATHRFRMQANGVRLLSKATGGSTGVPLRFDLDHGSADRRFAATYRGYGWAGAGPGTKQLYLWGVPFAPQSRFGRIKETLYNQLHRRKILNSFELSEARLPHFVAEIERHKPDVIVAYAGALYAMARLLVERGGQPWPPGSIVVGAEKLHGFQRDLIEQVFRAPVFETYGSREFMLIGAECERHEGLHVTSEHLLVEVLDDEGNPTPPGEEGNIVVTDLHNFGMPFIRYMNGDRAVAGWGRCSCGRGLPLLRKVVGRRLDVIVTSDGRRLPGEFFPHLIKDFDSVRQFQVTQSRLDALEVRLVVNPRWTASDEESLGKVIQMHVGPTVRVLLSCVPSIDLTRAGKQQVVVNRLLAASN